MPQEDSLGRVLAQVDSQQTKMRIATTDYAIPYYESIEFNLSTGQTNYDLDSSQATFLSSFGPGSVVDKHPTQMTLRTDQSITVKLNSTSNHAITVSPTEVLELSGLEIQNVYLTNSSGNTAAIKILFLA